MMSRGPFSWSTWLRSPAGLVLLGFLAVAAFFLVTEHTAHVLGVLPYLFLLLCPLMHLFMHGSHGGHGGHDGPAGHNNARPPPSIDMNQPGGDVLSWLTRGRRSRGPRT